MPTSQANLSVNNFTDVLQCGICNLTFYNLSEFLNHKIKHAAKSHPVECSLCGQSYNQQIFLRNHYKKKHNIKFIETDKLEKINRKQVVEDIADFENKNAIECVQDTTNNLNSSESCVKVTTEDNTDNLNTVHVVITKTNDQLGDTNIFDKPENASLTTAVPSHSQSANAEDQDIDQIIPIENAEAIMEPPCVQPSKPAVPKFKSNSSYINPIEEPDYHFIFINRMIKGKKFPYSKHAFKCLHCDFKTSWRISLCKHMSEEHRDMMMIHKFIEIKSPELDSNQKLLRMSEYLSDLHKAKDKKVKKVRGVEAQDKSGHFPCPKCDKVFHRLRYLRKHSIIHKTETKYLCDECGKAFKTKNYLAAHRRTHKTKTFKCMQCSFTSNVNSLIHAHRQLHNEGSVLCDICGQAYLDNSTLKKHKRVHDMNRPFACTFAGCTWRFNKEVLCQAHVKSHTTVGQFVCNVCQYSFRHKHHLQRHLVKLHGIPQTKGRDKKENSTDAEVDQNTVNFVIDSEISSDQLESAMQQGNVVISATDVDGNTVNYVTYHTLLEQETVGEADTIVIPPSEECNQIIFHQ